MSLQGLTWTFYNFAGTPAFRCNKPSDVRTQTGAVFLNGYKSKTSFWLEPNQDKCIGIATNYIIISDNSFNGDTIAFANYMNDKTILVPFNLTSIFT